MIKDRIERLQISRFDFFYMFVMFIYCAGMTLDTQRMQGGLSGNPIPLLIPIVLTIVLLNKHHVSFQNANLHKIIIVYTVWMLLITFFKHQFTLTDFSFHLFSYYAILVAYIHVKVFGHKLFEIYEELMVIFAIISLFFWLPSALMSDHLQSIFRVLPRASYGHHLVYLYNSVDPSLRDNAFFYQNSGCCNEPGRFALMLLVGITVNLTRNGIAFKGNMNIIWLLAALISTFSTTGYVTACVLFAYFFLNKKFSFLNVLKIVLVILPLFYVIYQLDFVGEKIFDRADLTNRMADWEISYNYAQKQGIKEDEYLGSLDRFEALYYNLENIKHDPILGYGRNFDNSYFRQEITRNYYLAGGLIQEFSSLGLFIGVLLWIILFKSSAYLGNFYQTSKPYSLIICFAFCNFSYHLFFVPIFTAMWMYCCFVREE